MVQYITYNKKKYPIKLGNYSIRKFEQENDVELKDAKDNIALYEPLLFFALQQGAKFERKELDLEEDDMPFVLDECLMQFVEAIPKFFPGQIPEELLEKVREGEGKQTGTKSAGKR